MALSKEERKRLAVRVRLGERHPSVKAGFCRSFVGPSMIQGYLNGDDDWVWTLDVLGHIILTHYAKDDSAPMIWEDGSRVPRRRIGHIGCRDTHTIAAALAYLEKD